MTRLTARGLARFFGARCILRDVSFSLAAGQTMLVAGPNGAGKSTLLKILAGFLAADAGEISLEVPVARRGYLGHQTSIYPQLTGLENLRFWAGLHGLPATDAALLPRLEAVGLDLAAHDRAGTYSRGMAQRLNLARVFLNDPLLLLLDEPATGLDTASTALLSRKIAAAREQGAAVIWVSHPLDRDLAAADLVLALAGPRGKGRPAYCGPAADYQPEEACLC